MTMTSASSGTAAAEIAKLNRFFEQAYSAGDAVGLVNGYFAADSHGPRACPPGGMPPIEGRAAITAMFTGMIAEVPAIRLETIDLTASDTVAFELGRAHLTTADGQTVMGRFTVGWIMTGDGWRAKTDFFAEDGWPN